MNIPEIYLVEPYNAYAPKGRKKHWHEVVEEQALMQRIMAEQIALQEAQSKTLPPNSPSISTPAVGNMNAGAGGVLPSQAFHPTDATVNFDRTPSYGIAPFAVTFMNYTTNPELYTYLWQFGDGTTSTDANPVHTYDTSSSATALFTASLQATSSVNGIAAGVSPNVYTSGSIPKVTAIFSYYTSSGPGPITATFTNGSTNTSQTPSSTYLWTFGDTTISPLASPPVHSYANTGSFTASVQITGSYALASVYTQSFYVPAPTLTGVFTYVTSSGPGPITATFTTSSTMYNGHGLLTSAIGWIFGDGSSIYYSDTVTHAYSNTGSFTASLHVTESSYNIKAATTQMFYVSAPTVTATFTFVTESNAAASSASFTNTSTCVTSSGTLTYLWDMGSGSLIYTTANPPGTVNYINAGSYTASLQVTESNYGIASKVTHAWKLT